MGCDIRPVLERRWANPKTGETKWVGLHDYPYTNIPEVWQGGQVVAKNVFHIPWPQQRNYGLFARLAGVRGDGPEPKGLPEDASDLTLLAIGDTNGDLHSHSWASATEYIEASIATYAENDAALRAALLTQDKEHPILKDPFQYFMGLDLYPDEDGPQPDDFRICFAFDN